MKITSRLSLLVVFIVLLSGVTVSTPTADGVTIHTLLIIDDAAPNFRVHEKSKSRMSKLLVSIRYELRCPVNVSVNTNNLSDPNDPSSPLDSSKLASSANVLKWVSELNPDADDVVWVYYSGPGGVDARTGNFYLFLAGEKFSRNRLVEAMDALPCRLKILMTDPCEYGGERSVPLVPIPSHSDALYKHLFYEHEGFFNVTAATKGEYALSNQLGGVFTFAVSETIRKIGYNYPLDGDGDLDGDGFVSWEEVFKEIHRRTNEEYEMIFPLLNYDFTRRIKEIGQKGQNPVFFGDLPKRIVR